jgi:hypothetical protein
MCAANRNANSSLSFSNKDLEQHTAATVRLGTPCGPSLLWHHSFKCSHQDGQATATSGTVLKVPVYQELCFQPVSSHLQTFL